MHLGLESECILLLYANDTLLLAENLNPLQQMLDRLCDASRNMDMKINVSG